MNAYGIAVYLVMYHVVMPLVDMHPKRTFSAIVTAVLIHIFWCGCRSRWRRSG